MFPELIRFAEALREKGKLFGSFEHRVLLDRCLEYGVMLRVTSNRRVNVRKGNRPGLAMKSVLEQRYPVSTDAFSPGRGFTYTQAREPIGREYASPVILTKPKKRSWRDVPPPARSRVPKVALQQKRLDGRRR